MDKIILTIGIVALITSIGIIFLATKAIDNPNQDLKNKAEKLIKNVKTNLKNFDDFGTGYFTGNMSPIQKEAIRLKLEMEQVLGIDGISNVDIHYYQRPTNKIGIQLIKNDLSKLSDQLEKKNEH